MSNIPEFFAPDMSVDFEELGERIDLDKIRSDEILSANGSRQNLPMNLLNILNDENSIHPDAEYDSKVEAKDDVYAVNLNKMSIEHLLQNDDVNEISCTNYFSEILMNDNEEYSVKKVKSDYVEISPLKPNLLNENAFTSFDDIVRTHIDDVVGSPQQKDAFKDVEGEYTHISQSNERETVEASLGNHVTSIESGNIINLSDNAIIERASVLKSNELIDSLVINKSGSGERTTRETAFENSDHLQNFVDKDMSNEDSNDLQTGALHLLADLAIADINASPVLVIEEVHNISQSEINAQVWNE
ncbi:hypothetical protein C1645_749626 [Glomus cerebriforme]|uniref:Uncharacterized protein n=1 Tax=Glomus cerebriforme TaxID=658196 RepID=A0A397TME0_9GLOM|nr:hypothetical protein C1645_749626 [Glomus cerebriforme]